MKRGFLGYILSKRQQVKAPEYVLERVSTLVVATANFNKFGIL